MQGILSLTKSIFENFECESYWNLVTRFLRLYMTECFRLQHLNFIIAMPQLFILWQTFRSSGGTLTRVSHNALQTLASKTSSCILKGTGFT